MKPGSEIKAVVFDIDGTLTKETSWSVIATSAGGTPEEDLETYYAQKTGKISDAEADRRILGMWTRKGLLSKQRYTEILTAIPLREDALDLVNYLKSQNILICLITGAMDLYAEVTAKRLGVDNYYGNAKLYWDEHENILNFTYQVDQGSLKLAQFREFCQKYNLRSEECVPIGDSDNDYLLFVETKKGIAVKTEFEDKDLEAVAWQVVNNLSEIKKFI